MTASATRVWKKLRRGHRLGDLLKSEGYAIALNTHRQKEAAESPMCGRLEDVTMQRRFDECFGS